MGKCDHEEQSHEIHGTGVEGPRFNTLCWECVDLDQVCDCFEFDTYEFQLTGRKPYEFQLTGRKRPARITSQAKEESDADQR